MRERFKVPFGEKLFQAQLAQAAELLCVRRRHTGSDFVTLGTFAWKDSPQESSKMKSVLFCFWR
jgi:hypothetical protein